MMEQPSGQGKQLRPGIDLLLTTQLAELEGVHETTVLRWIEKKGLPATKATTEQIAELIREGYLKSIPPWGVYLIPVSARERIPKIRAYPKGTKRPRKGKTTGAGNPERA